MSSSQEILVALQRLEDSLTERLTVEMDRGFDGLRLDINGRFDGVEVRLERLETEYEMVKVALGRIEGRLAAEPAEREQLRSLVADLKARVASLSERLEAIEIRLASRQS